MKRIEEVAFALILTCSGLLCWTLILHVMATQLEMPVLS